MSQRRKFTDYEKKTVYANGNGKCAICGRPITFAEMTVDHKVPLSKCGDNRIGNLQPACKACNLMKNSLTMQELYMKAKEIVRYDRSKKIKGFFAGGAW